MFSIQKRKKNWRWNWNCKKPIQYELQKNTLLDLASTLTLFPLLYWHEGRLVKLFCCNVANSGAALTLQCWGDGLCFHLGRLTGAHQRGNCAVTVLPQLLHQISVSCVVPWSREANFTSMMGDSGLLLVVKCEVLKVWRISSLQSVLGLLIFLSVAIACCISQCNVCSQLLYQLPMFMMISVVTCAIIDWRPEHSPQTSSIGFIITVMWVLLFASFAACCIRLNSAFMCPFLLLLVVVMEQCSCFSVHYEATQPSALAKTYPSAARESPLMSSPSPDMMLASRRTGKHACCLYNDMHCLHLA